jgi:putative NADH-flavin reductase
MKLIVFGATGGIGSQVVEQALAAGHEVTGIVHSSPTIPIEHEHFKSIHGDVFDPENVRLSIVGKDAVISALGVRNLAPTTLFSYGLENIIQAMQMAGVRRLICISAIGLDPGPPLQRWIAKPLMWAIFKNSYRDLVVMEEEVMHSNLDWTILRAARLNDGPRTGQYYTGVNQHLLKGSSISRADVADYILTQLDNPTTYRAIVEIAQ